ncbi:hypothetical protein [Acidovorax sp. NCPPB 3576]|nr:hypothetical protein [Acidovorax sp. NCPPB 3576]
MRRAVPGGQTIVLTGTRKHVKLRELGVPVLDEAGMLTLLGRESA